MNHPNICLKSSKKEPCRLDHTYSSQDYGLNKELQKLSLTI